MRRSLLVKVRAFSRQGLSPFKGREDLAGTEGIITGFYGKLME